MQKKEKKKKRIGTLSLHHHENQPNLSFRLTNHFHINKINILFQFLKLSAKLIYTTKTHSFFFQSMYDLSKFENILHWLLTMHQHSKLVRNSQQRQLQAGKITTKKMRLLGCLLNPNKGFVQKDYWKQHILQKEYWKQHILSFFIF